MVADGSSIVPSCTPIHAESLAQDANGNKAGEHLMLSTGQCVSSVV
jgi:hypothetical protein